MHDNLIHRSAKLNRITFLPFAGFSEKIPGYPRYSMIGDRSYGVFNLRIQNASLDDDAEFQCQVGPAKNSDPIRTAANLTVICKYQYWELPSTLKSLRIIKLCKHSPLSWAMRWHAWCDLCKQDPLSISQVDVYTQALVTLRTIVTRDNKHSSVCERACASMCLLPTSLSLFFQMSTAEAKKSPNTLFVQRSDGQMANKRQKGENQDSTQVDSINRGKS